MTTLALLQDFFRMFRTLPLVCVCALVLAVPSTRAFLVASGDGWQRDGCLPGWSYMDGQCYKLNTTRTTRQSASDACKHEGGHLARADTRAVNAFLNGLSQTLRSPQRHLDNEEQFVWLNAIAEVIHQNRIWTWTDIWINIAAGYSVWCPGLDEPNDPGEDCLVLHPGGGEWYSAPCDASFASLCQRPEEDKDLLPDKEFDSNWCKDNPTLNPDCSTLLDHNPGMCGWGSTYVQWVNSNCPRTCGRRCRREGLNVNTDNRMIGSQQANLNYASPDAWIGHGGPTAWPARSPDVTPLDFFLWGYVKGRVYKKTPVNDIDHLKEKIRRLWRL